MSWERVREVIGPDGPLVLEQRVWHVPVPKSMDTLRVHRRSFRVRTRAGDVLATGEDPAALLARLGVDAES
jgi:hypothetical protein